MKGKKLTREQYEVLMSLGIEVVMYDVKEFTDKQTGEVSTGFEIWGGLKEDVDFDELFLMLKLLIGAKDAESTPMQELYKQLVTMYYLTEKPNE